MLGLGSGLVWDSSSGTIVLPEDIEGLGLIAWYDFTDSSTLYQDVNSYDTAVSSNNDKIGRCKNKAYHNFDLPQYRLGRFIRALTDAKRPTYKTNGQNGLSYAFFDNSSNDEALITTSSAVSMGAHSTDILSLNNLRADKITMFIVGKPSDDDSDGTSECFLSYYGYNKFPTATFDSSNRLTKFKFTRDDDEDIHAIWNLNDSSAPISPNSVDATQVASHWTSSNVDIINLATSALSGSSFIYNNNYPDVGQNVYGPVFEDASFQQNPIVHFDPDNYDDSEVVSFCVGGEATGGVISSNTFEGSIYEVLVWNDTLSNSNRSAINHYLANKYDITISN